MKIAELLEESIEEGRPKGSKNKKKKEPEQKKVKPRTAKKSDDTDDDLTPSDPDQDVVPNMLMQVRKAMDVDGNYSLKFADGSKHKVGMDDLKQFARVYLSAKPSDRDSMQSKASQDLSSFKDALKTVVSKAPKSIYT